MFTLDDMVAAGDAAVEAAKANQTLSKRILDRIRAKAIRDMAFDNAASEAERHGDPAIEDAINDLKDKP